jgi:AAA domain (dynein-related subfamily)
MKETPLEEKLRFVEAFQKEHGESETVTRTQIQKLVDSGAPDPTWLWVNGEHKVGKGTYRIPEEFLRKKTNMSQPIVANMHGVKDNGNEMYDTDKIQFDQNFTVVVPPEDPLYVPFGNYYDVETITKSGKFFPYWIFGLSGNGKTLSIEQAHARLKKKLIIVPITREADEDALLGGLRLSKGDTVPFFGPVTMAALLGVTCLLDETDLGDEKLMCLQTALQNRPFPIKRLGKVITPQPGFNIVATANTKGQGSDSGKFIGTNIMNEAMLDRYVNFFDQEYPPPDVERQILTKILSSLGHNTDKEIQFVERLIDWGQKIRLAFAANATTEVITTRRLVHVCRSYDMYGKDRKKAIQRSISRFQATVQKSFLDYYKLIDEDWAKKDADLKRKAEAAAKGIDDESPF